MRCGSTHAEVLDGTEDDGDVEGVAGQCIRDLTVSTKLQVGHQIHSTEHSRWTGPCRGQARR